MTKLQALYQFFSSFGIPAYEEGAFYAFDVSPDFPYITYSAPTGAFKGQNGDITANCSIWYRTTSLQEPEAKATEISKEIGLSGKIVKCEDGYLWIKRGSPFCTPMTDDSDTLIRRMYININYEFMTSF